MLRSVKEQLESRYNIGVTTDLKMEEQSDLEEFPRLSFPPEPGSFKEVLQKPSLKKIISYTKRGIILPLLPDWVLDKASLLNAQNLVALFDCSGFAYGDQWSPNRLISRTQHYEMLSERNVKLIMLPQALGPFSNPEIEHHAKKMFSLFDYIFPRESASKLHLLDLGIDEKKIEMCPDISHLLHASPPDSMDDWAQRVTIVPNARMLDKTDSAVSSQYLNFLALSVKQVTNSGLEPVILLHETNDDKIANQLMSRLDIEPKIFDKDGITSKGYLGHCYANIGSRYHSLVSSLSQGTPSLGTSWAHKYEELFTEYSCEDFLISPADENELLTLKLRQFLHPKRNKQLRKTLQDRADMQKKKVERMWQKIFSLLSPSNGKSSI